MILQHPKAATRANPYVGPRALREDNRLYGRDREVRELADLLIAERVVLLHAPSGAGKTSLIQAALLPVLEREGFRVSGPLRVNTEPPPGLAVCNRYVWSAVLGLAGPEADPAAYAETSLTAFLDDRPPDAQGREHMLVFDQFEEILTLDAANWEEQEGFFADVGHALANRERSALFSMREDFMGGLERYRRYLPTRLGSRYRLDFLLPAGAREAVIGPAEAQGVAFADAAADKLVANLAKVAKQCAGSGPANTAGIYVEPLFLQVVCRRLWRKLDVRSKGAFDSIGIDDLDAFGGLAQALESFYTETVQQVAKDTNCPERAIRDWFDRELITETAFRRQTLTGPEVDDPERVLRGLEDLHLIRSDIRAGQRWYEIAHDQLVEPVGTSNNAWRRANLSAFQCAADDWDRHHRDASYLLRGDDIRQASRWLSEHKTSTTEMDREFVEASRAAWRDESWRTRMAVLVPALALIAVLEFVFIIVLLAQWLVL